MPLIPKQRPADELRRFDVANLALRAASAALLLLIFLRLHGCA